VPATANKQGESTVKTVAITGASAGGGAARALAFGAVCAVLAAGFAAARKLNR